MCDFTHIQLKDIAIVFEIELMLDFSMSTAVLPAYIQITSQVSLP